jgi:3-phenylpropionate/trans-cinnamate dioxygenase ferredoxin reductase component
VDHVAVVGTGLAGVRAVEALRRDGYGGAITLVGDEEHLPYDRPPLSKQFLAGTWDSERISLRLDTDALGVDLKLGRRAERLDLPHRRLVLDGGEHVDVDGLVIATGARPRTFPGRQPAGVFVLRTLDDALALKAALEDRPRVVVIGAGFIGSEVAATCKALGVDVTIVEGLDVPLLRVLGPQLGAICGDLHRHHGVALQLGHGVAGLLGDKQVEGVELTDGTVVPAEVVVVGIGVTPNTEWLSGCGLDINDGVVCDRTCRAEGADNVVAAGDVARWYNTLFAREMRVEHWTNASEQADHAAATLLAAPGQAQEFAPIPYFWSDQYDTKIQMVGVPGEEVVIAEGSVDERKFVAVYGREGRTVGAIGFSLPRKLMQYRELIADKAPFPPG